MTKENGSSLKNTTVSIIIPCRNEGRFIEQCLASLTGQDYPMNEMEILVVDGMSNDGTREKVLEIAQRGQVNECMIKLLDNPHTFTPFALNIGIREAKGEVIVRADAHATYQKDYISKCVRYLQEHDADNVGGVVKTLPGGNTVVAKAIALALTHPFGVGGSRFRKGVDAPMEADTVFGGCYRRSVFEKIGMFNENLVRSQDLELNLRLKKAGGKIILAPDIIASYYPKHTLGSFFSHNIKDGIWAIYPLKFTKIPFRLRHYLPLIFILTLPLNIWPYIPVNILASLHVSMREHDLKLFFVMPIVFGIRHFGYGIGSLIGLVKLFLPRENRNA